MRNRKSRCDPDAGVTLPCARGATRGAPRPAGAWASPTCRPGSNRSERSSRETPSCYELPGIRARSCPSRSRGPAATLPAWSVPRRIRDGPTAPGATLSSGPWTGKRALEPSRFRRRAPARTPRARSASSTSRTWHRHPDRGRRWTIPSARSVSTTIRLRCLS